MNETHYYVFVDDAQIEEYEAENIVSKEPTLQDENIILDQQMSAIEEESTRGAGVSLNEHRVTGTLTKRGSVRKRKVYSESPTERKI